MKTNYFHGIKIFAYATLLLAILVGGTMGMMHLWGKTGEIIATLINVFALAIPFIYTSETHPFDKNLKKSMLVVLIIYIISAAFHGVGLLGNMLFNINTSGILIALLGLGIVTAFDIVVIAILILCKAISNRKLIRQ